MAKTNVLKAKTVNIGQIKPYWRNPRRNVETVKELKKSIEQFGFNVPLVVDEGYEIIAGHARYRALMELGVTEVACVVLKMSKALAREYRIADNKIHDLSSWMHEGLVGEVGTKEFLMSIPGFTQADADVLFFKPMDNVFAGQEGGFLADGTESSGGTVDVNAQSGGTGQGESGEAAYKEIMHTFTCPHCTEEFKEYPSVILEEARKLAEAE